MVLWVLFVLAATVLVGWFIAPEVILRYRMRRDLGDDAYGRMMRFLDRPLQFPGGWAETAQISPDLEAAYLDLEKALKEWTSDQALREGILREARRLIGRINNEENLSEQDWNNVEELIDRAQFLIVAVTEAVECVDYELNGIPLVDPEDVEPPYMTMVSASSLFHLRSHMQRKLGDIDHAFGTVQTGIRIAKRHPASTFSCHISGIAAQINGIKVLASHVESCEDIQLLDKTLYNLKTLDPYLNPNRLSDPDGADILGLLRLAKSRGVPVDLSPGRTGREYVYEVIKHEVGYLGSTKIPQRRFVKHFRNVAIDQAYAKIRWDRMDEAHVREKMVRALFDILCLRIANRIREIETGEKTNDPFEFGQIIPNRSHLDPFTDEAFLWDASTEEFYSIGPDETDHGNLLQYTPTNGIISVGDISLR